MKSSDLEKYLVELGKELEKQDITEPIRVLMVGGAYIILLTKMRKRTTNDIDVLFIDQDQQLYDLLLTTVQTLAKRHQRTLSNKWLNTDAAGLLSILGPMPASSLWRNYGPLEIYIPDMEYILAVKLVSIRNKDLDDAKYLCQYLHITQKEQARSIVYTYIEKPKELYEICDFEGNLNYIKLL